MSLDLSRPVRLRTPDGAPAVFEIAIEGTGPRRFRIAERGGRSRSYDLPTREQAAYLDLFEALCRDFGLRQPLSRSPPPANGRAAPPLRPLLTEPVDPQILYGYGDPCVLRLGPNDYRLLVTSNDAPNAFPILASADLESWRLTGFVFPRGEAPAWTLTGPGVADFWAPEMHWVDGQYWVCFAARTQDRTLAIGMARSPTPDGPFIADEAPIVGGGVIDPHVLVDADGAPWLIWKRDENDLWPGRLSALLHDHPEFVDRLFATEQDRRTAAFVLTLWPWVRELEPMEQFFVQQTLIEAATADFAGFRARLAGVGDPQVQAVLEALTTRIYAQRLTRDGRSLLGDPVVILENDQPWEAHLIEGVWVTCEGPRYYLLYAGNDFSTAHYGIGVAVADHPTGPYRKVSEVFLGSTSQWWGPGHPSVATGPDGRRHIFLHAFRPGEAGYKAFRVLLEAPIRFEGGRVSLVVDG
ncbi:MAG: hypothetical protein JWQ52_900 [Phenylobacterium sp.]|jgi:arabinan endo-1,5-alpha-L-arabinosidase|nr:hypothetical protein [Phenylobacterium sp.]